MKSIALTGLMVGAAAIAVGAFVFWPTGVQNQATQDDDVAGGDETEVAASPALKRIDAGDTDVVYDLGDDPILPLSIEDYKDWLLLNEEPYDANPMMMALCYMPPPTKCEGAAKGIMTQTEYRDRATATLLHVYVNDRGREAMMTEHNPQFPIDSVIVKEKWFDPASDAQPQLMTVMRKREAGFNPECGDWEFATFEGDGVTLTSQGRHASCMKCHTPKPETDFVFRSYLFGRDAAADIDRAEGVDGDNWGDSH